MGARFSALAVALSLGATPAVALPPSAEFRFTVLLDGRPIGEHRFTLATTAGGGGASVESVARFDVTLLGIPVYRYRHRASERWEGDCLASIDATTDDDGRTTVVRGRRGAAGFAIDVQADAPADAPGAPPCTMSFAYWHPALADQRRLLDPGSGRLESVSITPLPETSLDVGGRTTPVRGLRITGLARPIDVWYDGARWVGLDTTVDGARRLSYRIPR